MAKKLQKEEKGGGLPLWIGTFGDLMSLLLTFFILLLSMATFDAKKLLEAESSLKGALSILNGGIKIEPSNNRITLPADITIPPEYAEEVKLIEQSIIDFNEMTNISKGVTNIQGDGLNGFMIVLPTDMIFKDNFKINDDSMLFLYRISQIIKKMPKDVKVEILGRSNASDSATNLYRASNMALSIARALHNYDVKGSVISPIGKEDKTLSKDKNGEKINIRFYASSSPLISTKGLLN